MGDPSILFVKPKAISHADKKALRTAGVIVVEIDDPSSAKFVRAGAELSAGAMLKAATESIAKHNNTTVSVRSLFGRAICEAIAAIPTPTEQG